MRKQVVLHGILKEFWNEPIEVEAETAAEVIQAVTSQLPGLRERGLIVRAAGFNTFESLVEPTEVETIHLVPSLFGGGKLGQIIIGAVFIAAAFAIGGPGAGAFATKLSTALLASGIALVASGVLQLFVKAPSIGKENDPPASKYLGLGNNTTQIGTPIPLAYGRHRLGGHYLSVQINSSDMVVGSFPETP